jgi:prepilin-type N-terminal cleavage/methylation domain-containing protein
MIRQQGFTLLELLAVVIVLGILVPMLVPNLFDFSSQAATKVVDGVKGAISASAAKLYAQNRAIAGTADILNDLTGNVSGLGGTVTGGGATVGRGGNGNNCYFKLTAGNTIVDNYPLTSNLCSGS